MGEWYRVTKRINGRLYDYWQRTERHGQHVKTFNKYIGPAQSKASAPSAPRELHAGAFTIPVGRASSPSDQSKPGNLHQLKRIKKMILSADEFDSEAFSSVQDQLDYAYAVKADREKKREARRRTKGIKNLNPFIALASSRAKGK